MSDAQSDTDTHGGAALSLLRSVMCITWTEL